MCYKSARPEAGISCQKRRARSINMEYIAFDCHKRYTYAVVKDEKGRVRWEGKIVH